MSRACSALCLRQLSTAPSPTTLLDAGEPTALCVEAPANVFSRAWTKGVAVLDCNRFEAALPFESLPWPPR